jgi:hypothetical protein
MLIRPDVSAVLPVFFVPPTRLPHRGRARAPETARPGSDSAFACHGITKSYLDLVAVVVIDYFLDGSQKSGSDRSIPNRIAINGNKSW